MNITVLRTFLGLVLCWSGGTAAQSLAPAEADAVLDTLVEGHPRLMLSDAGLARLKALYDSDETLQRYVGDVLETADGYLDAPLLERKLIGPRLLSVSRAAVHRTYAVSFAWRWTGEEKYAKRAVKELLNVCRFEDWNPPHFLDTAEMSHAVGVGYDWLYAYLDDGARKEIEAALVAKGLGPGIERYRSKFNHFTYEANWNQVCNGGLLTGALAIADVAPEQAGFVVSQAIKYLPNALRSYGPDGVWAEGPGYWHYASRYTAYGLTALDTALGGDFGLSAVEGLSATGAFPIYMTGPTGLFLNYADSGERRMRRSMPCLFWLARTFGRSFFSDAEHETALREGAGTEHLMWYVPPSADLRHEKTLDRYFRGKVETIVFRGAWDDPQALFAGVKGGYNQARHGHLDLGNFEMDALGVRWARDLGSDDYNLPGYWDGKPGGRRWSYYRLGSFSHNVPVLGGVNQHALAEAKFLKTAAGADTPFVVIDLTSAYQDFAKKVTRGVALIGGRRAVLVQDEFERSKPCEISWGMTTDARITLANPKRAVLELDGKELHAVLLSPEGGAFSIGSAEQAPPQKTNEGIRRLMVELPESGGDARIAVMLAPRWPDGGVETAHEVRPLADW